MWNINMTQHPQKKKHLGNPMTIQQNKFELWLKWVHKFELVGTNNQPRPCHINNQPYCSVCERWHAVSEQANEAER